MLPQDPMMLLSYVNTQLRDNFDTFEDLCKAEGADAEEVISKLKTIDYEYDDELNKFV